jgi:hypothetical protein
MIKVLNSERMETEDEFVDGLRLKEGKCCASTGSRVDTRGLRMNQKYNVGAEVTYSGRRGLPRACVDSVDSEDLWKNHCIGHSQARARQETHHLL